MEINFKYFMKKLWFVFKEFLSLPYHTICWGGNLERFNGVYYIIGIIIMYDHTSGFSDYSGIGKLIILTPFLIHFLMTKEYRYVIKLPKISMFFNLIFAIGYSGLVFDLVNEGIENQKSFGWYIIIGCFVLWYNLYKYGGWMNKT
jgi:hypothetical protein